MGTAAVLPELLTTDQVAQKLGISAQTLTNWRATGRHADELPHIKIGVAVRYRADVVERACQEGIKSTTDTAA
jgi:transposase-like protein